MAKKKRHALGQSTIKKILARPLLGTPYFHPFDILNCAYIEIHPHPVFTSPPSRSTIITQKRLKTEAPQKMAARWALWTKTDVPDVASTKTEVQQGASTKTDVTFGPIPVTQPSIL